ncbi:MAG TPA: CinA family protein [Spirochaetales bacterium]|nr:CinA family protein [Spirochaetales bacterium]
MSKCFTSNVLDSLTCIVIESSDIIDFFQDRGIENIQLKSYKDRTVAYIPADKQREGAGLFHELKNKYPNGVIRAGDVPWIENLITTLTDQGQTVTTAESCTGGMIGEFLTDIPGSSLVYWGGFITYSNEAKVQVLGVRPEVLDKYGAVSAETVTAMAENAARIGGTPWALAVSGIAGPGGGSPEKPVGTVYIAVRCPDSHIQVESLSCSGSRDHIRRKSTLTILLLWEVIVNKNYDIDIEGLKAYI